MLSRNLIFKEVIIIEPKFWRDDRGCFYESYKKSELEEFVGHEINFVQKNESCSGYGVIRGLHYQLAPTAQAKLVSVNFGKVLDVIVDIRKNSETFRKHISIELTANSATQIYIPQGFAHGFVTLSEKSNFCYMVDNYYHKESERGIAYNDKMLNIDWKIEPKEIVLSKKDRSLPSLEQIDGFVAQD